MTSTAFFHPIQVSLLVAISALIVVLITGLGIGWFMSRNQFKGKTTVETMLILPLVLPPTVIGFLLIMIFGNQGVVGKLVDQLFGQSVMFTVGAAIIAAIVVSFPLMYQSVKTGFQSIPNDIENAARVDGANEWKVFRYISIPLCAKSIVSGIVLSFARALGEFGATIMFAGNIPGKTQTVPTAIYVAFESNQMGLAWAWVIAIVCISFIMLFMIRKNS
ncbi:molybdate ABC transporter permease subunit [Aquibacillus koreensis]|uniref:Molybdenum transport system permease n=1 Tax=Aquibacillus koreensis TaxID=279446 RepID=A0A9X3WMD6_9BACI|nr:molybdate ABC transporter permease subunit [Aquibacillus koreensis]MCT2536805.1 molybdate ABC transporter permease subunit [Aquibacillus koreensis]MDC3421438.1 molybdate ABC transporter permease subunit [Aquibacillus koreensis]